MAKEGFSIEKWSLEDLSQPIQFMHSAKLHPERDADAFKNNEERPSSIAVQHLLTEVRMNPAAARHIRDPLHQFQLEETLRERQATGLNEIPQFPPDAITIKAIWWPVRKQGYTAMPIWDGIPTKPIQEGSGNPNQQHFGNDFTHWDRFVAIDPDESNCSLPRTAIVDVPKWSSTGSPQALTVVLLRQFHYRELSADDVKEDPNSDADDRLKNLFHFALGQEAPPEAGDKLVLVGLHVATKELKDWVWMTFWWHDASDFGEFAADRPQEMPPPWRNYLMDIAVSAELPKTAQGARKAIFNPWLEAAFANGLNSNCLACHQRATYSKLLLDDQKASEDVTPGELPHSDRFFNQKVRLDYLWSLRQLNPK